MPSSKELARHASTSRLPTVLSSILRMENLPSRIIHLLPAISKYVLYLLLLLNIRSFPLVWHWKVFWPVTLLRIRYRLFRLSLLFKSRNVKRTLDAQWWDSVTPIGENPLESVVKYTSWASIDDSDFNIHLSNSSYAKALDSARFKAALQWFPLFFRNGGWCPLAATHYHFIREIPMFSNYEVRVRMGAWDDKWLYIICRFVTKPKKGAKPSTKTSTTTAASTKTPPDNAFISAHALHTPATDSELNTSVSPTPIPSNTPHPPPNASIINSLLQRQEHIEEPDGAVLHTTSVSQICFKYGRITVPPALALALNGFSVAPPPPSPSASVNLPSSSSSMVNINVAPPQSYSKTNPPPHWPLVQSLVHPAHGGHPKKVQAFFKGGWKDVPAKDRWWEACLGGEIEEKRRQRLGGLEGIRTGTEGVRTIL